MNNPLSYWEYFYLYEKVVDEKKFTTVIKDKFKGYIASEDNDFPSADALQLVFDLAVEKNPLRKNEITTENFFLAHAQRISQTQFMRVKELKPAPTYDTSVKPHKRIHRSPRKIVHRKPHAFGRLLRRIFLG